MFIFCKVSRALGCLDNAANFKYLIPFCLSLGTFKLPLTYKSPK